MPWSGRGRVPVSDAVYRDLVSTLFTMRLPMAGFGALYAIVGSLIYLKWPDRVIAGLSVAAVAVTAARIALINRYHQAGGASQEVAELRRWELAYELLTYLFAILLAALNVRGLTAHPPPPSRPLRLDVNRIERQRLPGGAPFRRGKGKLPSWT